MIRKRALLTTALCVALAACDSETPQPLETSAIGLQETPQLRTAMTRVAATQVKTVNEAFVDLAARIPGGFGGMFVEADGHLVVWLKDPSNRHAVSAILAEQKPDAPEDKRFDTSRIEIRQADFDWPELYNYQLAIQPIFRHSGVSGLDIQEAENRLVIIAGDIGTQRAIEAELPSLGVPPNAVRFDIRPRAQFASTLSSKERPTVGGYRIRTTPGVANCTMGVNGKGGSSRYLLTNSHCTLELFDFDSNNHSTVHQPTSASGNELGEEHEDPLHFTSSSHSLCPSGDKCRFSDAALFKYDTASDAVVGYIERTTSGTTVNSNESMRWNIVADSPNCGWVSEQICDYIGGTTLNFVGSTSGLKSGLATRSCVQQVPQTGITMICVDSFAPTCSSGDSGAPVFEITWNDGGPAPEVELFGMLYACQFGDTFFSRIKYIRQELNTSFGVKAPLTPL